MTGPATSSTASARAAVPVPRRPGTARVMVVDDHPVVRDGVALLLRGDTTFAVVGAAGSGQAALERIAELDPDLVLLDLRLGDMPGPEVVIALRAAHPSARIVVFTAHGERLAVQAALDAGAHGCLLKDAAATDLVAALHRVLGGERVADPRITTQPDAQLAVAAQVGLTRREFEVLRLAAQGNTNPEIAARIGLARNTVKTYLQSALHKLGSRNRVEAIGRAAELGLL